MKIQFYLSIFLLTCPEAWSQDASVKKNLETYIEGSLNYLEDSQVKKTVGTEEFKGEWPSYMKLNKKTLKLGNAGKIAKDSNSFTSSSIMSSLSEVMALRPQYAKKITPMLESAIPQLMTYKVGDAFGFWPVLDRSAHLTKKGKAPDKVRRPNNFYLRDSFINNASNVPEDADDTAMAYVALAKIQKLNDSKLYPHKVEIPTSIKAIFDKYRDTKRNSIHYYNVLHGGHHKNGSYLTWFGKEKIFTPLSWIPIGHKERYIPYGANEVDCVVNTNVLYALATFGEMDAEGAKASCDFINKAIEKKEFAHCGLYYPNRYHFHYTASRALNNGASCLDKSYDLLLNDLLENQTADGSLETPRPAEWTLKFLTVINGMEVGDPKDHCNYEDTSWLSTYDPYDRLQSTVNGAYSLMELYPKASPIQKKKILAAMEKNVAFLMKNAVKDGNKVSWKGGIFFAGGTLVRDDLNWHSDSYTTSMVTELLVKYSDALDDSKPDAD